MDPANLAMPTPRLPSAALWLRIGAAIYDVLPLLALWMMVAAIALLGLKLSVGTIDPLHAPWLYWLLLRAGLVLVMLGYFVISWRCGGQTIGMRAWRIRLVDAADGSLTMRRALLRCAVAVLSLVAAGCGFLWCLIDHDRRAWHDIAATTRVVRLPKD